MSAKKDECGDRKDPRAKSGLVSKNVKELRQEVKQTYEFVDHLKKKTRRQLCDMVKKDCDNMGGLTNHANSCYLDSTIMALFHTPSDFLRREILEKDIVHFRHDELTDLAKTIQKSLRVTVKNLIFKGKIGPCVSLRKLFSQFDDTYRRLVTDKFERVEWLQSQQEPADVINLFIRLFDIPDACTIQFMTYGYANRIKHVITDETRTTAVIQFSVSSTDLIDQFGEDIHFHKSLLPIKVETTRFDPNNKWVPSSRRDLQCIKKKEVLKLLNAPMLYVRVDRNFGGQKLRNKVIPIPFVKPANSRQRLYLSSIICHHGDYTEAGHYTAFLWCKNAWYHYDDLGYTKMRRIGDYDALDRWNKSFVYKNAVTFIYL